MLDISSATLESDKLDPPKQEFHTLQELPDSLGYVSSGPFGSVARKDHLSWKNRPMSDPGYWVGRLDHAIGRSVRLRPVTGVAICFGFGVVLGVITGFSEKSR